MSSTRRQIVETFRTRLQTIAVADGFNTDAGAHVFLGESPVFGPDDPDTAIEIVIGDDAVRVQGENVFMELPVSVAAIAKPDASQPWIAVESVLEDIKKAIELEDRQLGGLVPKAIERGNTRTLPRESGSTSSGLVITYNVPYAEKWGAP